MIQFLVTGYLKGLAIGLAIFAALVLLHQL